MYFIDWLFYRSHHETGEEPEDFKQATAVFEEEVKKVLESNGHDVKRVASETPYDARSIYKITDDYIDVRTFFDEWRGGAVFGLLGPFILAFWMFLFIAVPDSFVWFTGVNYGTGSEGELGDYLLSIFFMVSTVGVIYVMFRYFFWLLRMECLVQRHIVIRFNRNTRKVYINRPKFAGGNKVYDWDVITPSVEPSDPVMTGDLYREPKRSVLMLMFLKQQTGEDHHDIVLAGAPLRSDREMYDLWEYIRRFMEEGRDSVPEPRCIPTFPWPWRSFLAPWSFIELQWHQAPWSPKMIALVVLVSPAMLVHAVAHWCSLLTCWPVYWPKTLRRESTMTAAEFAQEREQRA